jgi:RNA polymerase sigma factor (sigma-70 family)
VDRYSAVAKNKGYDLRDLRGEGMAALLEAIDRYDPNRGAQFSSYANPVIIGKIKNLMRGERRQERWGFYSLDATREGEDGHDTLVYTEAAEGDSLTMPAYYLHEDDILNRADVITAARRLPRGQREAFTLHYFGGLHGKDIVRLWQSNLNTINSLTRRARKRIIKHIHNAQSARKKTETVDPKVYPQEESLWDQFLSALDKDPRFREDVLALYSR